MKYLLPIIILFLITSATPIHKDTELIIMTREQFENQTIVEESRGFTTIDQVITTGNHLLVLEKDLGIHLIDISNFATPEKTAFLKIPACEKTQAKGDTLYIQSAVDLVLFDLNTQEVILRHRDFFSPRFILDYPNVPEGSIAIKMTTNINEN
jgi:hypothetical protein